MDQNSDNNDENEEDNNEEDNQDDNNQDEDEDDEDEEVEDAPEDEVPQEFMFDAVGVPMDAELLQFAGRSKSGGSGGRGVVFSTERGRYIKPDATGRKTISCCY
jgi:magnesium chelatase subunit D